MANSHTSCGMISALLRTEIEKARWFRFERTTSTGWRDALDWLGYAYEAAGEGKKLG
jgi:hypothetical protein